MRIVCVSDTHGQHAQLRVPDGDVLVHAGDFCRFGRIEDVRDFSVWLGEQAFEHRVVIAGNHDLLFERQPELAASLLRGACPDVHYLFDSGVTIGGLEFWGSPWQPRFFDWAFNLDRGEPLRRIWESVPDGTDVLITHGPPHGVLDRTEGGDLVGCEELRAALPRIRPKLHVFGHIHEGRGEVHAEKTHFVNASIVDVKYRCVHAPIVVDL